MTNTRTTTTNGGTVMRSSMLTAALGAALAAGCGIPKEQYDKDIAEQKRLLADAQSESDKDRAEIKRRDDKIALLLSQNDTLAKKLESLGQDVSRLQTETGSKDQELDQARKRMEELRKAQAQAEARAAQFRKLVTQFKALTDSGKLKVVIRENRMIVQLGDQILFDPGRTELKKEGQDALAQVAAVLKDIPNRNFQVAGHTDNVPIRSQRFRSNWDLSTARGVEVTNFLISSGMDPKHLSAAGYADQSPVAANDTPENKAKNRRIEITLVPNLDDLPPIDETALK